MSDTETRRTSVEGRCKFCRSTKPGRRGMALYPGGIYHRFRQDCETHPVLALCWAAKVPEAVGMNFLTERRLISDLCVNPEDVASVDLREILRLSAGRYHAVWLQTMAGSISA